MRGKGLLWLGLLLAGGCTDDPLTRDIKALDSPDAVARRAAAQHLAGQHDPRAAAALADAIDDGYPDVRCAVAEALGSQDPAVATPALLAMFDARKAGYECAIAPLGRLHDARAAAPLMAEAKRRGNGKALAALVELGPGAVGALVGALRSERDPRRAEELARALVDAGHAEALPPLLGLIVENDRATNANAAMALGLLGDPKALEALVKAADAGIGTAPVALARLGKPGQEVLLARLDHPKEFHRRAAADAHANATDPGLVAVLEAGLAAADDNIAQRNARLLVRFTGPGHALQAPAIAALERAWTRNDLRTIAAGAEYFVRAHADRDDVLVEALEMHGDDAFATALLASPAEPLRAAGAEWRRQRPAPACTPGTEGC
jgi:HEAT repeat protein